MYYVHEHDNTIEPVECLDGLDLSRCFATVEGCRRTWGVPVTPISMKTEPVFEGDAVIANGWSTKGLEPCGVVTTIKLEGGAAISNYQPKGA